MLVDLVYINLFFVFTPSATVAPMSRYYRVFSQTIKVHILYILILIPSIRPTQL